MVTEIFAKGDRVRTNAYYHQICRRTRGVKTGEIVRVDGHGTRLKAGLVRVLWDHTKYADTIHPSFLERIHG